MKKFYQRSSVAALVVAALLLVGGASVQAQGTSTSSESAIEQLQQQVQQLQERVQQLREQIRSRVNPSNDTSDDDETSSDDVFEDKEMEIGDRGENVRQLQQLLAQDRDIYPEGLATGYYGQLTSQAVARLQQRIGIPDTGEMNEETIQRVRDLIENGAGNSGITPPGLLHAPGIQRFFSDDSATTTEEEGDEDDDSEARNNRRGPDIENLSVPEEVKERLRAIFNRFGDDKDDDDEDGDDDELEIEAEAEDGETKVEVEYADGSEEEFTFDTTDRDEVIARLVEETNLTEEEIEAVLEFEIDDEDEDEDDDEDEDEEDDEDDDSSTTTDSEDDDTDE